jgi:8-oxo-dGTP pyrophosphatase MutT (NUDIX family)
MKNPWKTLGTKIVYQNPWIKVREDQVIKPDGTRGIYGVVDLHDTVFIVALTPEEEIYLIRQFRYTTKIYSWEIPAGSSDGQSLLKAAKRELKEESGLVAKRWEKVGKFQSMNGVGTEIGWVFIAQDLSQTGDNHQAVEAIYNLKKFKFKKVLEMIKKGQLTDSQSITAITMVALHLGYI